MTFGERLKTYRKQNLLSQEKLGELMGVSRQAVAKWEADAALPTTDKLAMLSSVLGVSLDELAKTAVDEKGQNKAILRSNLTLLAIILQAAALNIFIQPWNSNDKSVIFLILICKTLLLIGCSVWMALNLRCEQNPSRRRKNAIIELVYCAVQAAVAIAARHTELYFWGGFAIVCFLMIYIFYVNPKYMNRRFTRRDK